MRKYLVLILLLIFMPLYPLFAMRQSPLQSNNIFWTNTFFYLAGLLRLVCYAFCRQREHSLANSSLATGPFSFKHYQSEILIKEIIKNSS